MGINSNQYQGVHEDENGIFFVFWHDDSNGWFWVIIDKADEEDAEADFDFEDAIGPYATSYAAFEAASCMDFSINH